jgi:hypothetical protein
MAHAYTPGLKVTPDTVLTKRRILPLEGEVLVEVGRRVSAEEPVARAELPGRVHPLNLVNRLGVSASSVRKYLLKAEGDAVEEGEVIAETQSWIKLLRSRCRSPVSGRVESVSDVTGQIMLREPPQPVVVRAYVSGRVVEVMDREGASVETRCAFAQGIFGVGGEKTGRIRCLDIEPGAELTEEDLPSECEGLILAGGAFARKPVLDAATRRGARGLLVGGMDAADLQALLGYDIGVAVTGSEPLATTVIITEGFGHIPMARRTHDLLRAFDGRDASINGATQIRAGVMRPEILIPLDGGPGGEPAAAPAGEGSASDGIRTEDEVRIIREPLFGRIGRVARLISDPVVIETEASVRVLEIRLDDGTMVTCPRANVEVVEK